MPRSDLVLPLLRRRFCTRSAAVLLLLAGAASGCAAGIQDPLEDAPDAPRLHEKSVSSRLIAPETIGLKLVLGALKKPLMSLLGKGATSVIMNLVFGKEPKDYTAQLDAIQADLAKLNTLVASANDRLVFLEQTLRLSVTEIEAVTFSNALVGPTTAIETPYSGSASGAIDGCDPAAAVTGSLCWFYSPLHSPEEKQAAVASFLASTSPATITDALAKLSLLVVPNDASAKTLLDNYADLVASRLDPVTLGPADAIDAIEGRFLSLLRTQVHGMQLVVASYQMQAETGAIPRATADANIDAALKGIARNFSRQADAYLRAVSRFAAVAGGDPRFLVVDPATGALHIDPALQGKLARAPAIAEAVRGLATNPATDTSTADASDAVHAFFLARLTDDAFGALHVTARDLSAPRQNETIVRAGTTLGPLADVYTAPASGYVMHTNRGRYGAFVAPGGVTQLTLADGWVLYEVNLMLDGHGTGDVELGVETTTAVGEKPFRRVQTLKPAFAPEPGEATVYIGADDFRGDGPTSRVDLWGWAAPSSPGATCSCQDFGFRNRWAAWNQPTTCSNGLSQTSGTDATTGVRVSVTANTGPEPRQGGCALQEALTFASSVRDAAANAVAYAVTTEKRQGDVVVIGERRVFCPTPTLDISCDNNRAIFSDTSRSPSVTSNVAFAGQTVGGSVDASVFSSSAALACQDEHYEEPGWGHMDTTVWDDALSALTSYPATTWTGAPSLSLSKPLVLTAGQDSTVTVSTSFKMPPRFQRIGTELRLTAFGVYAP